MWTKVRMLYADARQRLAPRQQLNPNNPPIDPPTRPVVPQPLAPTARRRTGDGRARGPEGEFSAAVNNAGGLRTPPEWWSFVAGVSCHAGSLPAGITPRPADLIGRAPGNWLETACRRHLTVGAWPTEPTSRLREPGMQAPAPRHVSPERTLNESIGQATLPLSTTGFPRSDAARGRRRGPPLPIRARDQHLVGRLIPGARRRCPEGRRTRIEIPHIPNPGTHPRIGTECHRSMELVAAP